MSPLAPGRRASRNTPAPTRFDASATKTGSVSGLPGVGGPQDPDAGEKPARRARGLAGSSHRYRPRPRRWWGRPRRWCDPSSPRGTRWRADWLRCAWRSDRRAASPRWPATRWRRRRCTRRRPTPPRRRPAGRSWARPRRRGPARSPSAPPRLTSHHGRGADGPAKVRSRARRRLGDRLPGRRRPPGGAGGSSSGAGSRSPSGYRPRDRSSGRGSPGVGPADTCGAAASRTALTARLRRAGPSGPRARRGCSRPAPVRQVAAATRSGWRPGSGRPARPAGVDRRVKICLVPNTDGFGSRTWSGRPARGRPAARARPSPARAPPSHVASASDLRGRIPDVRWTRPAGCISSVS